MESPKPSSHEQTTKDLRALVFAQGIWGVWGQMIGTSAAVFNGFALSLGASASFIALMATANALMSLAQLLAPLISSKVGNQKRFVLCCRILACLLRTCILFIPFFLPPALQPGAMMVLVSASMFCLQAGSPFYGSWQANLIPENIRARFTSRQITVSTLTSMVAGLLVGRYIDSLDQAARQEGIMQVFALSIGIGILSVWALSRASFPTSERLPQQDSYLQQLLQPFRDGNFRRALIFFASWQFARGLAEPFYSIFMLDSLHINYTTISIFSMLAMAASIAGYRLWAGLIDRYGSKAVLTLMMAPHALVPLVWIFNRPQAYDLVAVAMIIGSFLSAGISVGITPLLYGLLPQGERRPIYMGCWSAGLNLTYALSTLCGSILAHLLDDVQYDLATTPIGNLQIIFLCSAVLQIVPVFLLRLVNDNRSLPLRQILAPLTVARVRALVRQRWTRKH